MAYNVSGIGVGPWFIPEAFVSGKNVRHSDSITILTRKRLPTFEVVQSSPDSPPSISFEETYAATEDGDIYRYIADKWFKLDPKSTDKTSVSVGIDGTVLASDRASSKNWSSDHEKQKFNRCDVSGVSADVYNADHVVVVKDKANNVKVKSGDKWTHVKEKCLRTSAFSSNAFYCATPEGDVKIVE